MDYYVSFNSTDKGEIKEMILDPRMPKELADKLYASIRMEIESYYGKKEDHAE